MIFRNCLVVELILRLLLCLDSKHLAESRSRERLKRLSEPEFDPNYTLKLAKYVVSIRSRLPYKYYGDNHFCGGVIVAEKFVLTSAQCIMTEAKLKYTERMLCVVAGTVNKFKYRKDVSVNMPIQEIYTPLNFTSKNSDDIALLKTSYKFPSNNPMIKVIKLPNSKPVFNVNYTVLGWGRIYKGGPLAAMIHHINVTLFERKICLCMMLTVHEEMLCAGSLNKETIQHPCDGDQGAPMIRNDVVYGVASYRLGCGDKDTLSIYTDVWYHIDWINSVLKSAHFGIFQGRTIIQSALISVSVLILL